MPALAAFDLCVRRGEIVAVLGPNGAGKTTALRTLVGILAPDAGVVELFGASPRSDGARTRLGWQAQQTALYPLIRVDEAIELFASYYPHRRSTDELLDTFGLTRCRGTQFRRLSGGQRQRLALALAFVNEPELVVLDEPTMAIDIAGRTVVWNTIRAFRATRGTVLLATHLIEEAEALADRVMFLHRGRVIASGTRHELVARHAQSDSVELTLGADSLSRDALLAELARHFAVEQQGDTTVVSGGQPTALMRGILEAAIRSGADLLELRLRRGSLEDAFLELTRDAHQ